MTIVLQTLVLIASLATAMWAMLKFLLKDIHRDLDQLKKNMEKWETKYSISNTRIDQLFTETNRLYHVCIDMLKDKKSTK